MFILCFLVCWVLLVWYIKPFVRVGFAKCISVGLCLVFVSLYCGFNLWSFIDGDLVSFI